MLKRRGHVAILLIVVAIVLFGVILIGVTALRGCGMGHGGGNAGPNSNASAGPASSESSDSADSDLVILIDGDYYFVKGNRVDFQDGVLPLLEDFKTKHSGTRLTIILKDARMNPVDNLRRVCNEKSIPFTEHRR